LCIGVEAGGECAGRNTRSKFQGLLAEHVAQHLPEGVVEECLVLRFDLTKGIVVISETKETAATVCDGNLILGEILKSHNQEPVQRKIVQERDDLPVVIACH